MIDIMAEKTLYERMEALMKKGFDLVDPTISFHWSMESGATTRERVGYVFEIKVGDPNSRDHYPVATIDIDGLRSGSQFLAEAIITKQEGGLVWFTPKDGSPAQEIKHEPEKSKSPCYLTDAISMKGPIQCQQLGTDDRPLLGVLVGDSKASYVLTVMEDLAPKLDEYRRNICRAYDAVVEAVQAEADDQIMRNRMDNLHKAVDGVANFEGLCNLKPLPANYTTLNRFIP